MAQALEDVVNSISTTWPRSLPRGYGRDKQEEHGRPEIPCIQQP